MIKRRVILILILIAFISETISAKDYKGAEYRTKATFTYGRFEVNYKATHGAGQTSTFFTYHELGSEGVNEWNELDIEILGRYTNDVQFNPITPGQVNHEHHQWVDFDPTAGFHTYAIEWTPDYVAWFVEGTEVYRATGDHITALNRGQKIMMNIWPPAYSDWVGFLDDNMLPFFAYYDWVSYASYTPGSGDVGTGNNFTRQWRDEFNSWDTSRWEKATHTFIGNNCDFIPENCLFQDGKMILCLTDAANIGYTDKIKPFMEYAQYENDTILVAFSEEITRESAENTGNYALPGITIKSAAQQINHRHVKLAVDGIDEGSSYSLIALGIKDLASPANSLLGQSVSVQMPPNWDYPIKINVGGDAFNDWLADREWEATGNYGWIGGHDGHFYGQAIANTTDDVIYQSEQHGLVNYNVRLPGGTYNVILMLAENYFNSANSRLMEINVEGKYVVRDIDLYATAGIHTAYTIDLENIIVTDGILNIHFGNNKDYSLFNGLVIDRVGTEIDDSQSSIPSRVWLAQNYPNPFNPATTIEYHIVSASDVRLTVFDLLGRKVVTLVDQTQKPGNHQICWRADVPAGIYLYRLDASSQTGYFSDIRKMLLIK